MNVTGLAATGSGVTPHPKSLAWEGPNPLAWGGQLLDNLPHSDPGDPVLTTPGRFLLWIGRQQKKLLALGVVWGVIWMVGQALIPGALGEGIQAISKEDETKALQWAGVVLALGVVQAGAGLVRHRYAVANWVTAGTRVQQLLIRRAAHLGADLPKQVATGEVVAASANDVERIGNAFDILPRMVGAVIAFFVVAIILITRTPPWAIIVLVGVPLLSSGSGTARAPARTARAGAAGAPRSDPRAGRRHRCGSTGAARHRRRGPLPGSGFRPSRRRSRRPPSAPPASVRSSTRCRCSSPGSFVVIVTWLGARLALQGELTVGQLVAFYGYTAFLVLPLRTVTEAAHKFTAARVAVGPGDHRDDSRAHVRRGRRSHRARPDLERRRDHRPAHRVWSSHPGS